MSENKEEVLNEREILNTFQQMSNYLRALQQKVIDLENERYENKFFFFNFLIVLYMKL